MGEQPTAVSIGLAYLCFCWTVMSLGHRNSTAGERRTPSPLFRRAVRERVALKWWQLRSTEDGEETISAKCTKCFGTWSGAVCAWFIFCKDA